MLVSFLVMSIDRVRGALPFSCYPLTAHARGASSLFVSSVYLFYLNPVVQYATHVRKCNNCLGTNIDKTRSLLSRTE